MTILENVLSYLPEDERDYWLVYGNDNSLIESVEQYSKHKADISIWASELKTEYNKQKAYRVVFESFECGKYDQIVRNAKRVQFILEHKDFRQEKTYCHNIALQIAYCKYRSENPNDSAESDGTMTRRLMPPLAISKACDDGYLLENEDHKFENQKQSLKVLITALFRKYGDNMPNALDIRDWVINKKTGNPYDASNITRYIKAVKGCKTVQ